ncbi:hypothetical protein [Ralstonia mannitolilytica]|uniref:hypothetical protein n=1 Tax=Ralstonia mannitolilytica TaxID=105219 RepID=UPI003B83A5E3
MRKRSSYRPRASGLPLVFGLSQSMKTDLHLTPLGILEGFKEGTAKEEGAHTLAAAVNLAAVLSRELTDHEKRIAAEGLEAVRGVFKRGNDSGKWGCSGDEYRAIGAALALGAELADGSRRREVAAAIKTVLREAGR